MTLPLTPQTVAMISGITRRQLAPDPNVLFENTPEGAQFLLRDPRAGAGAYLIVGGKEFNRLLAQSRGAVAVLQYLEHAEQLYGPR